MPAIKLGQLYGSGSFTTSSFSTQQTLSSGLAGDILTLTAPVGKKVRLDSFSPAAGQEEIEITLTVDGVDVVTNKSCGTSFVVGKHLDGARWSGVDDIVGSSIIVTKVSGVTVNPLLYSYSFGE